MRKTIILFAAVTAIFLTVAFIIKSRYYYFPYPNLIDYVLGSVLLVFTAIAMTRTGRAKRSIKLLIGVASIAVLMVSINLLNLIFEWHPLNLKLPFSSSQSFEVDHEPYEWQAASPERYGYNDEELHACLQHLEKWERLRALLVVKDDKLIIEEYFSGATRYSAFNVHSVTKSVTSALVGLALKHNYIQSEDDPILPFFPEYRDHPFGDFKRALRIKHLLSMRGGWVGGDGHQTAEEAMLQEHLSKMPDSEFKYFTGGQNVLSAIIAKTTKQSTKAFADKYLFEPLGIQNAFWRKVDGYYCGGDESYFTARDLARFGQLYLDEGVVDNKLLVDSAWIRKTFTNYTDQSREFRSLDCYDEVGYGLSWWIFKSKTGETIYTARGKGGQHVMVIPENDMVVVILQEWNPLIKNERLENRMLGELLGILLKESAYAMK